MENYLIETPSIDYMNPLIQNKVRELMNKSEDNRDYIKRSYIFVRDEIPHSWNIKTDVVSKTASEVIENKTAICWTKSCILAALRRANKIPSGISYQLLTRAYDASEGYMIHALNTLHIKDLNKWIRLDAREMRKILMHISVWMRSTLLIQFKVNWVKLIIGIIMMIWMKDWLIYLGNVKIY